MPLTANPDRGFFVKIDKAVFWASPRRGKRPSMTSSLYEPAYCTPSRTYISLQVSPVDTTIVISSSSVYTDTLYRMNMG